MARQRGTSGRRVGSSGRSEVVGAMLRGELGVGAEGEQEVEVKAEAGGEAGGVPLTDTIIDIDIWPNSGTGGKNSVSRLG